MPVLRWRLFVDESGEFCRHEDTVVVTGVLARDEVARGALCSTSPAVRSKPSWAAVMRYRRTAPGVVLAALAVCASACASEPTRTTSAIASEQLAASVSRLQLVEIDLYGQGSLSVETHRAWQTGFKTIGEHLLLLNATLRAGNDPTPHIEAIVNVLDYLSTIQTPDLRAEHQLLLRSSIDEVRAILVLLSSAGE